MSGTQQAPQQRAARRDDSKGGTMNRETRDLFISRWKRYFGGAELPIVAFYTDQPGGERAQRPKGHRCIFADLAMVREGRSICFDAESIGCGGGRRYLGFTRELMPNFEYFLSCGIPGELEGERYKKSPELVREALGSMPSFTAPARHIVFKRWDRLEEGDDPEVVIFFARPDVISGLFTLANFDEADPNAVFTPFAAGCGQVVGHPYLERAAARPRCVLGLFDVSARPFVSGGELTFAAPMNKFERMVDNMEESFLITPSWERVRKRL